MTRPRQSHQVGICQSLAAWVLNETCIATPGLIEVMKPIATCYSFSRKEW